MQPASCELHEADAAAPALRADTRRVAAAAAAWFARVGADAPVRLAIHRPVAASGSVPPPSNFSVSPPLRL